MRVLCGYFDLNTRICGSTRIYAGIVATLHIYISAKGEVGEYRQLGTTFLPIASSFY